MHIRASVSKNPGFCTTNTQKNTHEHENLRTCDLRICVSVSPRFRQTTKPILVLPNSECRSFPA